MSVKDQCIQEWGDMDAKKRIKILAFDDQTFTQVKEFFKTDHPEDEKVVLNYYLEALYESMQKKIPRHIYNVFENFDETMIANWMTFAYGKKPNENDVRNLLQNVDFYKCLTDLENQDKSFCFDWVFKFIKKCFQEAFIETQNLNGIFAIYQCLLRCEHSHHSPTFCNAVRTLCNKCGFENDVVLLEPETNSETDAEHQRLAELVENFTDTHLENVKKLIKDFFKPTNMVFSLLSQGTKQTLAIEGHNITLSAANKEINERIKRNTEIKSVLLRAKHLLILDQDVTLPSVTFACNAAEVVVTKPVKINLSGKDAEVDQSTLKPAKSGKQKGEKGEDGKDGKAGHPSGNFAITAKKLKGKQNLNLILNGGNGTNGQDGGDSAEGEDGVGENFDRLDSLKYEFEQGFKRFGRIVSAGIGSSLFNKKVKVKMENGNTELIIETPYYLSLHTIDFVKGSDGKRGECGGKNGLGGEGGKKGKCMIKINGVDHVVKGESRDGQAGQNGLPGKNGGYGLEGWDIAKATKTFGKTRKYGTSFNEKLSVEYTTVKTEGTFCVVAEDEGPESKCYAYIKARKCEKKVLRDHELRTERKDESERSGEAIAQEAVAIETEALDQDYENPINEEVDAEVEQEINEENDFERIIDFCIDLAEDEYVAKERPKQLLFSSKDIENLNIIEENSYFWNSTINVSVENMFEKYKNAAIVQKLRKKQLIFQMRSEKNVKNDIFSKWKNLYSHDILLSMRKNVQEYYTFFTTLRNLKVNGRNIDLFLPKIEKAFKKKKDLSIFEYTVISDNSQLNQTILNPVFNEIRKAYDQLSDDIKKYDPVLLFYYFKICENLDVYNVFCAAEIDDYVLKSIKKFLLLQENRSMQAKNFLKQLSYWTKKYACDYDFTCTAEISTKMEKFFNYLETTDITTITLNELEIICTTFPATGITFLNTLLLVFEVEGCHIDIVTIKYMIDTVFNACSMYGTMNCYVFPAILFSQPQENWLDEFVFFNLESSFNCRLEKNAFIKKLKKIEDENLKILCTKKISELFIFESITEEELLELFKMIKSKNNIYPQLKDIKLNKWKETLEEINIYGHPNSPQWKALDENRKKNVLFWYCKLFERFGSKNATTVFNNLIELSHENKDVAGRFMHRLCSDEYVIDIESQPLKVIFDVALECLKLNNFQYNDEPIYQTAKQLLEQNLNIDKPIEQKLDDIKMLFKKLNPTVCDGNVFQNVLRMVSTDFEKDVKLLIDSCADINPNDHEDENIYNIYKEKFQDCIIQEEDLLLLEIFNVILKKKLKYTLRLTQKIAILSALQHGPIDGKKNGILQQVATGEGKTYIIAAVSIISALKGHTVNIITSSSVLAKRDVLLVKPLFEAFNLKVDHIYHKCPQQQKMIYSTYHVIYGDLTTFQRDFLMARYQGGDRIREFKIVIIDEVDSLLLDNGLNTLYLSHKTADFEMLHSVLIEIWNLVNQHVKNDGKCKNNENFYQKVYAAFFSMISWQDQPKTLEITEDESNYLKKILVEIGVAEDNGELLILKSKILKEKLESLRGNFEILKFRFYLFHV